MKIFKHQTARNALTYGSATIITQALMMVYQLIIARWLGADQYGYVAAAYSAASLSAFAFNWGFNEWMMKAGATAVNPEAIGGKIITLKFLLGLPWGIILWISLKLIRPDLYLGSILLFTIIDTWIDSIFFTLLVILVLRSRVKLASQLLALSRVLRLIAGITLILFGLNSITMILVLRMAGSLLMAIIAFSLSRPVFKDKKTDTLPQLLHKSSAFNLGELLNLVNMHADVNILSFLGANSELIGNFSVAISLIHAIITLPGGIYNVTMPSLARDYQEDKSKFTQQIRNIYIGFGLLGFVLWASITFLGKAIVLTLLGAGYGPTIELLIWIAPLLILRTFNQANISYLVSVGLQAKRLFPQAISLIIKIGFEVFSFLKWGTRALIIVSIISEGILFILYLVQVNKHKIKINKIQSLS